MNKVILIGRLGKDPVVKKPKDVSICSVSLATSEKYKNNSGETVENTDWHNVVFWGRNAEVIGQYCIKGTLLSITGKNKTRSYDKDGQKVYVTEVYVDSFEMLAGLKPKDQAQAHPQAANQSNNEPSADELSDLPF